MSTEDNLVYPKVLGGYAKDVGCGIARLDKKSMDDLGIGEGDTLEIRAKRKTYAKCKQLLDFNKVNNDNLSGTIRIDGLIRVNSGSEIGDTITVSKAKAYPASEITMKPVEDIVEEIREIQKMDKHYLADCLDDIPLVHGDIITVKHNDERLFFQVIETMPMNHPIIITKETIVHIVDYIDLKD